MSNKTCYDCKEEKNINEYSKNKLKSDGHSSQCKACKKLYSQKNKEKLAKYRKEYREKNKEVMKEKRKKKVIEKIPCDICNVMVSKYGLKRHQKGMMCLHQHLYNNNQVICNICNAVIKRPFLNKHQKGKKCQEPVREETIEDICRECPTSI